MDKGSYMTFTQDPPRSHKRTNLKTNQARAEQTESHLRPSSVALGPTPRKARRSPTPAFPSRAKENYPGDGKALRGTVHHNTRLSLAVYLSVETGTGTDGKPSYSTVTGKQTDSASCERAGPLNLVQELTPHQMSRQGSSP